MEKHFTISIKEVDGNVTLNIDNQGFRNAELIGHIETLKHSLINDYLTNNEIPNPADQGNQTTQE